MKHYGDSRFSHDKYRDRQRHNEHRSGGFKCSHCKQFIVINDMMGTANRNHCNICLWSKHVDEAKGDRRSSCMGGMQPIGLTFKHEGCNKIGEIMLIHLCSVCQKISINRIARDDLDYQLLAVFSQSHKLANTLRTRLLRTNICILTESDTQELFIQLFGK